MAHNWRKFNIWDVCKLESNLRWVIIKRVSASSPIKSIHKVIGDTELHQELKPQLGYTIYKDTQGNIYRSIQVYSPLEDEEYMEYMKSIIPKVKIRKRGICFACSGTTKDYRSLRCKPCNDKLSNKERK